MVFVVNEATCSCCGRPSRACTCNRSVANSEWKPTPLGLPEMEFGNDEEAIAPQYVTNEQSLQGGGIGLPDLQPWFEARDEMLTNQAAQVTRDHIATRTTRSNAVTPLGLPEMDFSDLQ